MFILFKACAPIPLQQACWQLSPILGSNIENHYSDQFRHHFKIHKLLLIAPNASYNDFFHPNPRNKFRNIQINPTNHQNSVKSFRKYKWEQNTQSNWSIQKTTQSLTQPRSKPQKVYKIQQKKKLIFWLVSRNKIQNCPHANHTTTRNSLVNQTEKEN